MIGLRQEVFTTHNKWVRGYEKVKGREQRALSLNVMGCGLPSHRY